ncbi:hypothetical protein JCM19992_31660 [Thermostilla marina]
MSVSDRRSVVSRVSIRLLGGRTAIFSALVTGCMCLLVPKPVAAQETAVTVPSIGLHEQYYERSGIVWALRGPNWFARFGGPDWAQPQTFGLGTSGGPVSGGISVDWSHGTQRSATGISPTVVVPHGGLGSVSGAQWRPFVTGIVPVPGLGGASMAASPVRPIWIDPLTGKPYGVSSPESRSVDVQTADNEPATSPASPSLEPQGSAGREPELVLGGSSATPAENTLSSAEKPVAGLHAAVEARQEEQRARDAQARDYLARGDQALRADKPGVAKIYYQQALRYASASLAEVIRERLERAAAVAQDHAARHTKPSAQQ